MTITVLAEYLKPPTSRLYRLLRAGKAPGVTLGRHWRFHRQAMDRWVSAENDLVPIQEEKA